MYSDLRPRRAARTCAPDAAGAARASRGPDCRAPKPFRLLLAGRRRLCEKSPPPGRSFGPVIPLNPAFARMGDENAFAVLAKAAELTRQGRDIVNLGIGQPDFKTPPHIVEAAVKALRDGEHGYTAATGIPPLREAVAADLHRRFGVEV